MQRNAENEPMSYAFTTSDQPLDCLTLGEHLSLSAAKFPDKKALISCHEGISWSFRDIDGLVTRTANALANDFGVTRGDTVGLWSSNSATNVVIQYAAARLGLILCTLNPAYKENELKFALEKSEAKVIFLPGKNSRQETVNKFWDIFSSSTETGPVLPHLKHVVALDGQVTPIRNEALNVTRLEDLKGELDPISQSFSSDASSIIMFTSGTTGLPKGAVLSHFNVVNNAKFISKRLSIDTEDAVSCIPVPLFHVFGMVYGSVMMAVASVPLVLTGYRYKTKDVVQGIQLHNCTHAMIVPAMTVDLLKHVTNNPADNLPSLKYVVTGSAPTPPDLARNFIKGLPHLNNFYIRYGSTETGGCMTLPFPTDQAEDGVALVGSPLDLTEVKVCHPKTGTVVPIGSEGELWVRGHHVMPGYFKNPEKTREAIEDGWFKTGDMGFMNDQGHLSLKGRTKEMIIRGGENIYPKELENLLHSHPDIEEAHVCGVPDERMGQEVCAWVSLKDKTSEVKEDDIKAYCKDRISYFKVPKYILFVEDFPRTPKGSPQKYVMTEKSCEILGIPKE